MERTPLLSVEFIWDDEDLEEVRIEADNGVYSGAASVYVARGELSLWSQALAGFPRELRQNISLQGSGFSSHAELVFHCIDGADHTAVTVSLSDGTSDRAHLATINRVELRLRFESGSLDQFCSELEAVGRRARKKAMLIGLES
jgi:hypothetical protein